MKACHYIIVKLLSIFSIILLTACVVNLPVEPDDPYYAPVMHPSTHPEQYKEGSLYRNNTAMGLFSDKKAARVGDIITVVLQERTTSSKSSNVEMKKDNEIEVRSTPGAEGTIFGTQPSGRYGLGVDLVAEREFTGESGADQSNRLSGNITVTVVNVYPNGTLAIRGEKWMTLNRGEEYLRISGLVRPDDVTPTNTVMSTKIANARITYSGKGEMANTTQMGWISRFFNSPLWPF